MERWRMNKVDWLVETKVFVQLLHNLCTTLRQTRRHGQLDRLHALMRHCLGWLGKKTPFSKHRCCEALSGLAGEENTNRTAVSKHWVLRIHCWLHLCMRHCLGWLGKKTQTEQQLVNTGCSVFTVGFTLSWGTVWVGWGRKHKQNSS